MPAAERYGTITANGSESGSHTVEAGTDRLLVCAVLQDSSGAGSTEVPTNVRWGLDEMTRFNQTHSGVASLEARVDLYYLLAPATGTKTLDVNVNLTLTAWLAANFKNVDQTTPLYDSQTDFSTGAGNSTFNWSADATNRDIPISAIAFFVGDINTASDSVITTSSIGKIQQDVSYAASGTIGFTGMDNDWAHVTAIIKGTSVPPTTLTPTAVSMTLSTVTPTRSGTVKPSAVSLALAATTPAVLGSAVLSPNPVVLALSVPNLPATDITILPSPLVLMLAPIPPNIIGISGDLRQVNMSGNYSRRERATASYIPEGTRRGEFDHEEEN